MLQCIKCDKDAAPGVRSLGCQVAALCSRCSALFELRAVPIEEAQPGSGRWRDEMLVALLRRGCTGPGVPSPHEGDLITEYERPTEENPDA